MRAISFITGSIVPVGYTRAVQVMSNFFAKSLYHLATRFTVERAMGELQTANVDVVELLQTLGNTVRKAIVNSLALSQHPLRFSDLMEASGLNPNFDTGQFNYHLNELSKKNIITKVGNKYGLTQFGFKLSKLLEVMERECSFLFSGAGTGGWSQEREVDKPPFRIRPYSDQDYEDVAKLLMNMYNDAWSEMFGPNARMSLEEARKAVVTDLLVPDTRVLVLEHGADSQLVGFISYAIRYGGVFFIVYEWVEKKYAEYGYDDMLFQRVEEEAKAAGENALYIHVSHREHRFIEFLIRRGYDTLNMLELAKYLDSPPEPYSGKMVEIEGHRFKLR